MSPRGYRLGRRTEAVRLTRAAILAAARQLVVEAGPAPSVGMVARKAGVSRITVYNQFGSRALLLQAVMDEARRAGAGPSTDASSDPRDQLMERVTRACATWASAPGLYRQLLSSEGAGEESELDRALAERLASRDRLRPGCSIKEAEDVIGILTSFQAFDRLHKGGRRSPAAVAEILTRMAAGILGPARPMA